VSVTDDVAVPAVILRLMTASEFDPWRELAIRGHASQTARATGVRFEIAEQQARDLLPRMLPQGVQTEGMHFFVVASELYGDVGSLWLGRHPEISDAGYVFDIEIHDEFRGRGFGRAAMLAAEKFMRHQGRTQLALWVAGGNDAARALYDSLGYSIIGTSMSKTLSPATGDRNSYGASNHDELPESLTQ
jgi:ribosomal protein S18 acetylase RimI-like enzyme